VWRTAPPSRQRRIAFRTSARRARHSPRSGSTQALGDGELAFLRVNIEKRHVVGHNLGIVDERFAESAQDEQPGRTVTLLAEEVAGLAELCRQIVSGLDAALGNVAGLGIANVHQPESA
jgi:hypothetical protein